MRQRGFKDFEAKTKDFRELVDDKSLDCLLVATPDHWHAQVAIEALKAGKDVYCEKPLTLTVDEALAVQKAVKDTGRILQTGSQQRTDLPRHVPPGGRAGPHRPHRQGQDHRVPHRRQPDRAARSRRRRSPKGSTGTSGSARPPKVPYRKKGSHTNCHYEFRWWYEYSGGKMTDWGAHHIDIAQWALGMDGSGPIAVEVLKAAEPYKGGDGYNCHPSFQVQYTYANGAKVIAMSGGGTDAKDNWSTRTARCPSSGSDRTAASPAVGPDTNGVLIRARTARSSSAAARSWPATPRSCRSRSRTTRSVYDGRPTNHMQNFVDCVKSRKQPICNVTVGGGSVIVCHIGVIALRTGKKLKWDPVAHQFDDAEANKMLSRPRRDPWQLKV